MQNKQFVQLHTPATQQASTLVRFETPYATVPQFRTHMPRTTLWRFFKTKTGNSRTSGLFVFRFLAVVYKSECPRFAMVNATAQLFHTPADLKAESLSQVQSTRCNSFTISHICCAKNLGIRQLQYSKCKSCTISHTNWTTNLIIPQMQNCKTKHPTVSC